jgi:hypothetical protein
MNVKRELLKIFPDLVVDIILEKLSKLYRDEHKTKLYKSIGMLTPDNIYDSNYSVYEYMQYFKQVTGRVLIVRLKMTHMCLLTEQQAITQKNIREESTDKLYEQSFV